MSLASKLKKLREKNRQSLQQVADGVGISKVHVWELEKGTSANPSMEIIKRLAGHFGVPVAYFSDDSIEPEEAAALNFFREFDGKLSEKDWEALRGVAEALKAKKP
ncbi:helix-turn-helix domain-containing protein [Sphingobium baderi]|uniref:helix-turn-helix domain-containing protein n=1 Tax=Sphingobium baderi TaxID=1332080 RepID=UPI002B40E535|nr:helix-turn-helix transcriptional regulator [Sphingobium baderi]WRD77813.1 helix-turn-helix transcriptional regulator [Sphingobium baderi]